MTAAFLPSTPVEAGSGEHINSQLLGFLIEMAALQAERLRGIRDVEVVALELRQDYPRARNLAPSSANGPEPTDVCWIRGSWQRGFDGFQINHAVRGE